MDELTVLALKAAGGDLEARDRLVAASYPAIWQLCAALVDRRGADDLAQETVVRALRSLPRFRGDASARTWLLAVARNTCADELRRRHRRRRRHAQLVAEGATKERVVADASGAHSVEDLLGRLEPARRLAFVLTQHLGLSYDEAAKVCDCPPGTIRSRVARARHQLLELWDHDETGGVTGAAEPPA